MTEAARSASTWDKVLDVLAAREFRGLRSGFDRRPLIERANAVGGPAMRLLHWRTIAKLGRLPRSNEGQAVDAIGGIDAFGAPDVEVFMVSHRWLCPSLDPSRSHADNAEGEKARAIQEFSRWRRQWVLHRHGFLPEIFYWIDYSCMDQENTADAVPLLPLWVACCERFLRVETADYDERAWCRVEPLLSSIFSFADHHVSIGLDFRCRWPHFGERISRPILDPQGGKLTNPNDMKLILHLVDLVNRTRPANPAGVDVERNGTAVKCFRL
jgi:hypothetical protein